MTDRFSDLFIHMKTRTDSGSILLEDVRRYLLLYCCIVDLNFPRKMRVLMRPRVVTHSRIKALSAPSHFTFLRLFHYLPVYFVILYSK